MVAWNPFLSKDKESLELVQRRATKRAPGLRNLNYEQRLEKLNLMTLEERRIRGDLIQQYKIVKGHDIINWYKKPVMEQGSAILRPKTRGHIYRLVRENTKDSIRSNFFNNRIANDWNALPNDVVEDNTLQLI